MNRILIVEDDRDIAGNLLLLLKKEGFTAVAVGTREESLEQIRRESFDLVLLDLMLPDGNGYSVCTAIKREADIPVIFLTAMGDEESVVTGFELGADDYIAKPFRPLELVSRVKNVLRRGQEPVRAAGRGSACGHCEGDCNQGRTGNYIVSPGVQAVSGLFEPAG